MLESQCLGNSNFQWLTENRKKMDQSLEKMFELIEDNHDESSQQTEEMQSSIKPKLAAHLQDFCTIYQSVVGRYDHVIDEFLSAPKTLPQSSSSPGSDIEVVTPPNNQNLSSDHPLSSGLSKNGTESSLSLSDSDSESLGSTDGVNKRFIDPMMNDKELLEAAVRFKEDLSITHLKRQLYPELENKLSLELLQTQIAEMESQLKNSNVENSRLREELDASRERIETRKEEIAMLNCELEKKICDGELAEQLVATLKSQLHSERLQVAHLMEKVERCNYDLSERDREIEAFEVALCEAQEAFSIEKAQLQSEIANLLEKQTVSDAKLNELEFRGKLLVEKVAQLESEKMQVERLHNIEINKVTAELAERGEHTEGLNKSLDALKVQYDTLMAQKDNLSAELRHRDNQITEKEEHLRLVYGESAISTKLVDELKLRVEELEKDVTWQRNMIQDEAEKKKEAIRQLCFSLEYYRSGYKELCEAFLKHKLHPSCKV